MAPEVLVRVGGSTVAASRSTYNESADVYSFGLLLWEVMHQKVPFAEYDGVKVAVVLAPSSQRPPLSLPAGYEVLGPLISSCWSHDPAQRPPMSTCVEVLGAINVPPADLPAILLRPDGQDGVRRAYQDGNHDASQANHLATLHPQSGQDEHPSSTSRLADAGGSSCTSSCSSSRHSVSNDHTAKLVGAAPADAGLLG